MSYLKQKFKIMWFWPLKNLCEIQLCNRILHGKANRYSVILLCCYTVILSWWYTVILLYCYAVILVYCYVVILLYCYDFKISTRDLMYLSPEIEKNASARLTAILSEITARTTNGKQLYWVIFSYQQIFLSIAITLQT